MPLYQYQSILPTGKKKNGMVEAQSEKEARGRLREQGILVTKISEKTVYSSKQNLRGNTLLNFTIQLSQLVNAGIPLYESIVLLEEQSRGEPFHRVILSLGEQIKAGMSLSEAMAMFPHSFDKLYRSMVHAGETVGALNIVLEKLASYLKRQIKLKKEITTALIYPSVLGSFSLLIIALLIGFVVPSIEGIFEDRELNGFTQSILNISHFLREKWWIYFPLIGSIVAFATYKLRSLQGKIWLERVALRLPLVRTLIVQTSTARFCRTMATLLQGGLTMIDSLRISKEVMKNVVMEEAIQNAEKKIVEGSSLSQELTKTKVFPTMVTRMLSVGEDSGSMLEMLNKIADIYEEEVEKTLQRLMALAQPVILIVMGLMIGLILMAILLPMSDISSFTM
ncbi:General secretion pathway protein F [Candidatus Rubidus massiliensis]|nr:General secretion pathway protein F [Candidatus Rubidus massiliensis]